MRGRRAPAPGPNSRLEEAGGQGSPHSLPPAGLPCEDPAHGALMRRQRHRKWVTVAPLNPLTPALPGNHLPSQTRKHTLVVLSSAPRTHALTHTGTNRHCSYTILPSLHGCLSPPSPFLLLARSSLARGQPGIPLLTCCFHLLIIPNISEGLHTARGPTGLGPDRAQKPAHPLPTAGLRSLPQR